jgi:hypothetical protein
MEIVATGQSRAFGRNTLRLDQMSGALGDVTPDGSSPTRRCESAHKRYGGYYIFRCSDGSLGRSLFRGHQVPLSERGKPKNSTSGKRGKKAH